MIKNTFLDALFAVLEQNNFKCCILHSFENILNGLQGDIDICVDGNDCRILDRALAELASTYDYQIIQKLHYDVPFCFYYVLAKVDHSDLLVLKLDFLYDKAGINRYYLSSRILLSGRRRFDNVYIPEASKTAIYLLIKRVIKGDFSEKDYTQLEYLYNSDPEKVDRVITKFFGNNNLRSITNAVLIDKHLDNTKIIELKKLFLRQNFSISRFMQRIFFEIKRISHRIRYPTGVLVSILSPDGGGKSCVSGALLDKLLGLFREAKYLHWRPGLLPRLSNLLNKSSKGIANETVPHSSLKQGSILSFIRWVYYSLDFIFGHYLKLLPMKIKTTAIIVDRYYYDLIVDPYRYGFNLPRWLLKFVLPIVPKPDLCIYLDNSPEVLHARKQELPPEELRRQVEHWRDFIHELPNAVIVTTDKPINKVVNEATQLVMNRRAEMTKKMLKIEPEGSMYIWKSQLCKSYVALPSKKNCRWLIPTNPVMAEKAWDMYLPYSFWGKLYKGAFKSFAANGFMKMKKVIPQNTEVSGKLRNLIEAALRRNDFALAISTGTPGPFRKITAMIISSDGTILGYVKMGNALPAIERVKHEASVLKRIKLNEHESNIKLTIPLCMYEGALGHEYFLIQSPPSFSGKSRGYEFNNDYANILCTLIKSSINNKKFVESRFYRQVKYGVQSYSLSFRNLLSDGLKYLEKQIGEKEIEFSLSHGDFVPWNIVWNREEAFMFDWESAHFEAPVGIDLAHFLFQTAFLLEKLRGKNLLRYVTAEKAYEILADRLGLKVTDSRALLLCYLLKMAIDEDREQPLSQSAVERRNLIKVIIKE